MRRRNNISPIRNTSNPGCYRAGISFASPEASSKYRRNCLEILASEVYGRHVRDGLLISHQDTFSLTEQCTYSVVWMLGNLARATYIGSSNYVWPYSYNVCDSRNRKSQLINACAQVNHFGLDPFRGRGSPEIDIIEAMQGEAGELPSTFIERPYQSTSLQIAPGIEIDRPALGKRPQLVGSYWFSCFYHSHESHSSRIGMKDSSILQRIFPT
jgi:Beta-glucan synthesis-associated protein SKN1/KRE6/Sbg1